MRRWTPILAPLAALLVGCGGAHKLPFKTLARPPLPQQFAAPPDCSKLTSAQHVMGACLPHPKPGVPRQRPPFLQSVVIGGPDLSNNDPVYGSGAWAAIAAHGRFAYVKSTEGTGFFDPTAQAMAADAKAQRIPVGGYDFLRVCLDDPAAEARFFVSSLRTQGLLGPGTLRPSGDAENGNTSCNTRAWIATWIATVVTLTGITPEMYTGAWWWNPNVGSYWPAGVDSWISGYGVSYPYMPSGLTHLDFWQWSDHGYNGYNYADYSSWMHDEAGFAAFANLTPPPPPPPPRPHCFGPHRQLSNPVCVKIRPLVYRWSGARDATLHALDADRCLYAGVTTAGVAAALFHNTSGCGLLRQRATYFAQRVNANLY